jgi:hypothetical protein
MENRVLNGHVFAINGKKNGILHLRRGKTYFFDIKQNPSIPKKYPFYFCNDAIQGPRGLLSTDKNYWATQLENFPEPAVSGLLAIKVPKHCPKYFYYGSPVAPMMGGLVITH